VLSIRPDNDKGPAALRLRRELYQCFKSLTGVESVTTFDDVPLGGANVTTNDLSFNGVGPRFLAGAVRRELREAARDVPVWSSIRLM
jgi:hypothetical protein